MIVPPNQIDELGLEEVTDRQISQVRAALVVELRNLGFPCRTVLGVSGADVVRVDFLAGHDCGALNAMLDISDVTVSLDRSIAAWIPASLSDESRAAISKALRLPLVSNYCVETFLRVDEE